MRKGTFYIWEGDKKRYPKGFMLCRWRENQKGEFRHAPRRHVCIQTNREITILCTQKGSKPEVLTPGKHLISWIYALLVIKWPEPKWSDPVVIRVYHSNAREICYGCYE